LPFDFLHEARFTHTPLGHKENMSPFIKLFNQQLGIAFPVPKTIALNPITISLLSFFFIISPPRVKNNIVGNNIVGNITYGI